MPERFFEKISRNMIVTEKMQMTNIIDNSISDDIVFGMEVLPLHPVKYGNLPTFIKFLELSSGYEA